MATIILVEEDFELISEFRRLNAVSGHDLAVMDAEAAVELLEDDPASVSMILISHRTEGALDLARKARGTGMGIRVVLIVDIDARTMLDSFIKLDVIDDFIPLPLTAGSFMKELRALGHKPQA